MYTRLRLATLLGLMVALPVSAHAQRGMGPRRGGGGAIGNPVAPLINMRRELNLSARQLTQLDSIERSLLSRNQAVRTRLRAGMDSTARPRGRQMTDEQRTAMRARMDSMQSIRREIVRNDSTARAAALRVLTDSQRTQVRVRQAEQRGFAAGRAAAGRQQRGFRGGNQRQGFRGQQPRGPQGRFGPGGAGRPRMGPPGVGMGNGPMGMRGQRGPAPEGRPGPMGGGMRRMGPPDGVAPDDGLTPRRRGMMGGGDQGPMRRPPADSGR